MAATGPPVRYLIYSNPDNHYVNGQYDGSPLGDANCCNVAAVINQNSSVIGAFRGASNSINNNNFTAIIHGSSYITSCGNFTWQSEASCPQGNVSAIWAISYDGFNYTNYAGDTYSQFIYPGSSAAQSHHIYLRLTITDASGNVAYDFLSVYVNINCGGALVKADGLNAGQILKAVISPAEASLEIYPNPVETESTIQINLSNTQQVRLELINQLGQVIKLIKEGNLESGNYLQKLDLNLYPSGVYFCKLTTGNNIYTKKIIFSK